MRKQEATTGRTDRDAAPREIGIPRSDIDQLSDNVRILAAKAREYSHNRGNLELAALWMSDAANLQKVLDAVIVRDLRRARILVRQLETGARDEVPRRLYEVILRSGQGE